MEEENPYHILGVPHSSTLDEIKQAFRSKALVFHPDKGGSNELMFKLRFAYETLSNVTLRDEYDSRQNEEEEKEPSQIWKKLHVGRKLSDDYKYKINKWKEDFRDINIIDNFVEEMAETVNLAIGVLEDQFTSCKNVFHLPSFDKETPESAFKISYVDYKARLKDALNSRDLEVLLAELIFMDADNVKAAIEVSRENAFVDVRDHSYRVGVCFLDAFINKTGGDYLRSLEKLHEALINTPTRNVANMVSTIIKDQKYYLKIVELLKEDLFKLSLDLQIDTVKFSDYKTLSECSGLPFQEEHQKRLVPNSYLKTISKFEKGTRTENKTFLEVGSSYFDLRMSAEDPVGALGCLVMAGTYFVKEMENSNEAHDLYAYRNLVLELVNDISCINIQIASPYIQLHLFKLSFYMAVQANQILSQKLKNDRSRPSQSSQPLSSKNDQPLISKKHQLTIKTTLLKIAHNLRISPFINLPNVFACDLLYLNLVGSEFLSSYLCMLAKDEDFAEDRSQELPQIKHDLDSLFLSRLSQYYIFEGVWNGWLSDRTLQTEKEDAMSAILASQAWKIDQMEDWLKFPIIRRDEEGWLPSVKSNLHFPGKSYSRINGVEFDLGTGAVRLLLQEAKSNDGLFDINDIVEIFTRGITSGFLTLEHPNTNLSFHPFQEIIYGPNELFSTNYVKTLFNVDYLLKMMTTGKEVNSNYPFETRNAYEGFLKRLPPNLLKDLKVVADSRPTTGKCNMHRFWIEGEEVTYKAKEDRNCLLFELGNPSMRVKKHLLVLDEQGKIVDAENDNSDESPEAVFAQSFTKNYDTIGLYFPELLRLKELLKISATFGIIQSLYHQFQKSIDKPIPSPENLFEKLKERRNQIKYTDNAITNFFTTEISEAFQLEFFKVQPYVRNWLNTSNSQQLVKDLENIERPKFIRICKTIEALKINLEPNMNKSFSVHDNGEHVWVPAVFGKEQRIRVYGGVGLGLKFTLGDVQESHASTRYALDGSGSNSFARDYYQAFRSQETRTNTINSIQNKVSECQVLVEFLKVQENSDETRKNYVTKEKINGVWTEVWTKEEKSPEGGSNTIGYGHKKGSADQNLKEVNAYKNGRLHMTEEDAIKLLKLDIDSAANDARNVLKLSKKNLAENYKDWNELDNKQRALLTQLSFNVGPNTLRDFKKFINAILTENYGTAKKECEVSYADPTGKRKKMERRNQAFKDLISKPKEDF